VQQRFHSAEIGIHGSRRSETSQRRKPFKQLYELALKIPENLEFDGKQSRNSGNEIMVRTCKYYTHPTARGGARCGLCEITLANADCLLLLYINSIGYCVQFLR